MKLDFSALAQPAAKTRGQVGTTGTPAFTRVCASPPAQPGAGTTGDKPAALVLASDLVVAVPAACPPVSPVCPQAANAEKLNAGAVSPASPLVPVETVQVAAAPFVREDPDGETRAGARFNTCTDCLHLLRRGTCGVPVAAWLLTAEEGFGIAWPPEGHGAACPAFTGKTPTAAANQPYRLTNEDADRCHAPCWDDAEIARFLDRRGRLIRWGWAEPDAENLAERLTLRDREHDERVSCTDCGHYRPGRCGNHRRAGLQSPEVDRDLAATLQRCPGFLP